MCAIHIVYVYIISDPCTQPISSADSFAYFMYTEMLSCVHYNTSSRAFITLMLYSEIYNC